MTFSSPLVPEEHLVALLERRVRRDHLHVHVNQLRHGVVHPGARGVRRRSADADGVDGSSTDASFGSGMNNSVPELVNVNMEMVPADTPLKQGDQVFLGDER